MMKITDNIKAAQGILANTNISFLEFLEKNPGSYKRSNFNLIKLNDKIFKLQPWPTFINQHTKKEMKEAGLTVCNLIKSIPKRLFNNDPRQISQYFEIPLSSAEIHLKGITDRHLDNLLARGDFILTSSGLKCIEYNVTANLGGWQIPIWESLYVNTPLISKFIEANKLRIINRDLLVILLNHIIENALNNSPDVSAEINLAMVLPREVFTEREYITIGLYMNHLYKRELEQKNLGLHGELIFCSDAQLSVYDDYLFYNDKKLKALIEFYLGIGPLPVLKAWQSGNICLFNGPIQDLLSNKLNLALLSSHEDSTFFNEAEKEGIKKYIPWTRKIITGYTNYRGEQIDLKNFITSHRENLIIKPSAGYGGDGVHIGVKTSQSRWQDALATALKQKNWVVQEYLKPTAYLYQYGEDGCALCDTVWGFFVFGPHYAGEWVRILPQAGNRGVINCHQGAEVSVIFEVEE